MVKRKETLVLNLKELIETLKRKKDAHAEGFEEGVTKAAWDLYDKALEIVPIETGKLWLSGKVVIEGKGFETVGHVIFDAEYAIWVHERLDLAHGKVYNIKYAEDIAAGRKILKRPQEQAKFLESPLRGNTDRYKQMVVKAVRERGRLERTRTNRLKRLRGLRKNG